MGSGHQSCKWCHCYSCTPNQAHRVTVWSYPGRTSGVTQLLPLPTREGQQPEMLRVQCTRRSPPGQSCQPHLPEGCSLLCLPGTCLHFPVQLETVQGWMELAHGRRATVCSGFPRLNLSFCLEIECRWDLKCLGHPLWVPGQMTVVHEGTSASPVICKSQTEIWESGMLNHTTISFLRKRRAINSRETLEKPCQINTALGDFFPPLKPHRQTLGMYVGIT